MSFRAAAQARQKPTTKRRGSDHQKQRRAAGHQRTRKDFPATGVDAAPIAFARSDRSARIDLRYLPLTQSGGSASAVKHRSASATFSCAWQSSSSEDVLDKRRSADSDIANTALAVANSGGGGTGGDIRDACLF